MNVEQASQQCRYKLRGATKSYSIKTLLNINYYNIHLLNRTSRNIRRKSWPQQDGHIYLAGVGGGGHPEREWLDQLVLVPLLLPLLNLILFFKSILKQLSRESIQTKESK